MQSRGLTPFHYRLEISFDEPMEDQAHFLALNRSSQLLQTQLRRECDNRFCRTDAPQARRARDDRLGTGTLPRGDLKPDG